VTTLAVRGDDTIRSVCGDAGSSHRYIGAASDPAVNGQCASARQINRLQERRYPVERALTVLAVIEPSRGRSI